MTDQEVEIVAAAICNIDEDGFGDFCPWEWPGATEKQREAFRRVARVAIAALRLHDGGSGSLKGKTGAMSDEFKDFDDWFRRQFGPPPTDDYHALRDKVAGLRNQLARYEGELEAMERWLFKHDAALKGACAARSIATFKP